MHLYRNHAWPRGVYICQRHRTETSRTLLVFFKRHGRNAKPFVLRNRLSHLATPQIGKSVSIPPESRRGTYSNLHFLLSKEMRRYLASSRKFENVWWHLEITAPRSKLVSFRSNPFHSSIEVALAFAAYQTGAIVDAPADAWSTGHMPWCVGQSRCS